MKKLIYVLMFVLMVGLVNALSISNIVINSSSGTNVTGDNLSVESYTISGDTEFVNWDWRYLPFGDALPGYNGVSDALVNIPLKGGSTEAFVDRTTNPWTAIIDNSSGGINYDPNGGVDGTGGVVFTQAGDDGYTVNQSFCQYLDSSLVSGGTMMGWVQWGGTQAQFDSAFGMRDNTNCDFYVIRLQSSNNLEMRYRGSDGIGRGISGFNVTPGVWTHVTFAFDYDTDLIYAYKNGSLVSTTAITDGATLSGTNKLEIGNDGLGLEGDTNQSGFMFFPRRLSQEEIQCYVDNNGTCPTLSSTITSNGQEWYARGKPINGTAVGTSDNSDNIIHIAPYPHPNGTVSISPSNARNEDNLTGNIVLGNGANGTMYDWRREGVSIYHHFYTFEGGEINALREFDSYDDGDFTGRTDMTYVNNGTNGQFNSSSGGVLFANLNRTVGESLSIGAKVNMYDLNGANSERFVTIVGEHAVIRKQSTDTISFYIKTDGVIRNINAPGNASVDTDLCVVGTFDNATKEQKLYVNGVVVANQTTTGVINTSDTFEIGSTSESLLGTIDDVFFAHEVLSPGQINNICNRDYGTIDSNMTSVGENWTLAITPYNEYGVGETVISDSVQIGAVCSPSFNEDWLISDEQICDNVNRDIGTGVVRIQTGGTLSLINSANFTCSGLSLETTGDQMFIHTGTRFIIE
jgi:hypothetical protein